MDSEWEQYAARMRADAEDRRQRLAGQEDDVRELEALLFEHDPMGINLGDNADEYRAEAESILLRRAEAATVDDLTRIIHEVFVRWFDADLAGPAARYEAIAADIWLVWS
jgi:hypothetical protein